MIVTDVTDSTDATDAPTPTETTSTPNTPPARIRKRWLHIFATAFLGFALLIVVGLIAVAWSGQMRFEVISTGSMRPTLNPGDIAVIRPEPVSAVRVGQILAFYPPNEGHTLVIHRVISVVRTQGKTVIRTKGDANNAPDPWTAVVVGNTAWHSVGKVPIAGYISSWMHHRLVRLVIAVAVIILLITIGLEEFWPRKKITVSRPTTDDPELLEAADANTVEDLSSSDAKTQ